MRKIGIIVAVKSEISPVLADGFYDWEKFPGNLYRSRRFPLALIISGIGKVYATYALARIIEESDLIITMGSCAGLSEELSPGTLCLVTEFAEHDFNAESLGIKAGITPFSGMRSEWLSHISEETVHFLKGALEICDPSFVSGKRMISGDLLIDKKIAIEKKENFAAELADMESAAVAKICCTIRKREVAALRYITDNLTCPINEYWTEYKEKGAFLFHKILKQLIKMQREFPKQR